MINQVDSIIKCVRGETAAHYDYAPFGAVTAQRGTFAAANPWRFSSEYAEDDTGIIYYNYRHYDPVMGRWMSRDPIGEVGGCHLCCAFDNNPIERFDSCGLDSSPVLKDYSSVCRDAMSKYWGSGTASYKKWFQKTAPKGCKLPYVKCDKCCGAVSDDGLVKRGATSCDVQDGSYSKIVLCTNGTEKEMRSASDYGTILLHELIHAIDNCRAKKGLMSCEEAACSEIRAYGKADCAQLTGEVKTECIRRGANNSLNGYSPCSKKNIGQVVDECLKSGECDK